MKKTVSLLLICILVSSIMLAGCVIPSKSGSKEPIDEITLKIGVSTMATMSALGANPQPLSFAELYPALKQGTYEGQENPIPVIYNNKLYEVQEHIAITNHIYSGMCSTISESLWGRFSAEQKKIIQQAALNSAEADRKSNREQTESLLSELEANGMKVTEPELKAFSDATVSVMENNAYVYGDLFDKLIEWKKEHTQ